MKQINFTMSITCTENKFMSPQVQNLLSDQWKEELIESAKQSGFDDVEVEWKIEDLN